MDLRLHHVVPEGESSLSLLTVLVSQDLPLVVKTHAYVRVIVFLILSHFLEEMLELYF